MNTVLYVSPDGVVYKAIASTRGDIAKFVRDWGADNLTSSGRQFDFWFSSAIRPCHHDVNRRATEMLLATTRFNAKTVPLLRGDVLIASHDSDGDLDGLSGQQLDVLAQRIAVLSRRDSRILGRRIARDNRDHRRRLASEMADSRRVRHRPAA